MLQYFIPHLKTWTLVQARSMAASGFCPRCKTTHTLPTTSDAAAQVQQLHSSLQKSTLPQYPTIKKKGKVIGVLVCVDKSGTQTTTLKAFAGAIDGQWHVPDWSPVVGGVGTSPAELPLYQQIQQQTNVLAERQQHLRQLLVHPQYQEDNTLTCSSNSSRVANNNNTIDNSNNTIPGITDNSIFIIVTHIANPQPQLTKYRAVIQG